MKRLSTALVLLALWAVSCSQPGSAPSAGNERERPVQERSNDRASSAPAERKDRPGRSGNEDAARADDRTPATETASPGGEPENSSGNDGATYAASDDSPGGSDGPARRAEPPRPEPGEGTFTYAQSGWEEFCSGACRRSELPPSQKIRSEVSRTGGGGLRIVATSKSSSDRSTRSVSVLSGETLALTKLEFRYGSFARTLEPSPPIRSLRFPLEVGDEWASSWRADTSGRLEVRVLGEEWLEVEGRRVKTYKLDTRTTLKGDMRGTMTSLVWVDADTAAAVRTSGELDVSMGYGSFASEFDTMLLRGPGY